MTQPKKKPKVKKIKAVDAPKERRPAEDHKARFDQLVDDAIFGVKKKAP